MGKSSIDTIRTATDAYEAWLRTYTPVIQRDLKDKHDTLASGVFPFLRGTFYRWAQVWPGHCAELASAPRVLAVGDLHVENFGTWRDAEGRIAWGVNDFDEAADLPYTNDLVRLATSALLAIASHHLSVDRKIACEAILSGYAQAVDAGGRPFVADGVDPWFAAAITAKMPEPFKFWRKAKENVEAGGGKKSKVPADAEAVLSAALPKGAIDVRMAARSAGVGSLGRPRYVALADWLGGPVLREIKALVPSAVLWARGEPEDRRKAGAERPGGQNNVKSCIPSLIQATVKKGLRCPDPFFHVGQGWVRRRLAPDSRKIELETSTRTGFAREMLEAMGREVANVHLATAGAARTIRHDLTARGSKWLYSAAKLMRDVTIEEQEQWVKTRRGR